MRQGRRGGLRRDNAVHVIALQINGKHVDLDDATPLLDYLARLGVDPRSVAVEHNGDIVGRDSYAGITLRAGDVVEIVRMVGGGGFHPGDLQTGGLSLPDRSFGFGSLVPRL